MNRRTIGVAAAAVVTTACRTGADPAASPVPAMTPPPSPVALEVRRAHNELLGWTAQVQTPVDARDAGYVRLSPPDYEMDVNPLVGEHWIHHGYLRTGALAPTRPAYLMFYPMGANRRMTLVGVAHGMAQALGAAPPERLHGDDATWHLHLPCIHVPGITAALTDNAEQCAAIGGRLGRGQIAMVHVWLDLVPNPLGIYAADNPALPFTSIGLTPPTARDFADTARTRRTRLLAQALAEVQGARPRLTTLMMRPSDTAFASRVAPLRKSIRQLVPQLAAAENRGDATTYTRLAESVIDHWLMIREAYLDAAPTPALREHLTQWFEITSSGHRH